MGRYWVRGEAQRPATTAGGGGGSVCQRQNAGVSPPYCFNCVEVPRSRRHKVRSTIAACGESHTDPG